MVDELKNTSNNFLVRLLTPSLGDKIILQWDLIVYKENSISPGSPLTHEHCSKIIEVYKYSFLFNISSHENTHEYWYKRHYHVKHVVF